MRAHALQAFQNANMHNKQRLEMKSENQQITIVMEMQVTKQYLLEIDYIKIKRIFAHTLNIVSSN